MVREEKRVAVDGRELTLTNLSKVFWPEDGYTKADLIHYYTEIFSYLAPYLRDRPLVVTRYPNGIFGKSFYQKNLPNYAPEWIETVAVPTESEKRVIRFPVCQDLSTLLWLVNQGAVELHPWLSRRDKLDYPDFAVFDLDPDPPSSIVEARQVAQVLQRFLTALGLQVVIKTSGATGLHLYVPLAREETYEEVRDFCGLVAQAVAAELPDLATVERKVAKRQGKVYIDWLQNIRGQTICAPYSVRPLPHAPVSTPLRSEEVEEVTGGCNIKTMRRRIKEEGELFREALAGGGILRQALANLRPQKGGITAFGS
ncbi:MAG: DNA polymerase domain-containing protein [Firmicutes bacterium]|jgi:bifunctional non-homologous end joining protein LigD|nr:DNA polymerase domain-containing protein [Bacillota bacterium]